MRCISIAAAATVAARLPASCGSTAAEAEGVLLGSAGWGGRGGGRRWRRDDEGGRPGQAGGCGSLCSGGSGGGGVEVVDGGRGTGGVAAAVAGRVAGADAARAASDGAPAARVAFFAAARTQRRIQTGFGAVNAAPAPHMTARLVPRPRTITAPPPERARALSRAAAAPQLPPPPSYSTAAARARERPQQPSLEAATVRAAGAAIACRAARGCTASPTGQPGSRPGAAPGVGGGGGSGRGLRFVARPPAASRRRPPGPPRRGARLGFFQSMNTRELLSPLASSYASTQRCTKCASVSKPPGICTHTPASERDAGCGGGAAAPPRAPRARRQARLVEAAAQARVDLECVSE